VAGLNRSAAATHAGAATDRLTHANAVGLTHSHALRFADTVAVRNSYADTYPIGHALTDAIRLTVAVAERHARSEPHAQPQSNAHAARLDGRRLQPSG
jgi:hypothetical protein